jgi:hypothetical protein
MEALSELRSASSEIEPVSPMPISPAVSLELRVKWLEALLLGVRQETKDTGNRAPEGKGAKEETQKRLSLFRRVEDVQKKLDAAVASNEGLKRFMDHCTSTKKIVRIMSDESSRRPICSLFNI